MRVKHPIIPAQWGCSDFLEGYPEMALEPTGSGGIRLSGLFRFSASCPREGTTITDQFQIAIEVPRVFPREIPVVFETGGRIPRSPEFHVNADGSLCLGSPVRLLTIAATHPTLLGFVDQALVSFLFSVSKSLNTGRHFPFGELSHGTQGALADYRDLIGLKTAKQAKLAIRALSHRKRIANKHPCPCGCGMRLGRCGLRHRLNPLRKAASRSWFLKEIQRISLSTKQEAAGGIQEKAIGNNGPRPRFLCSQ